jgi:hypothetical protein
MVHQYVIPRLSIDTSCAVVGATLDHRAVEIMSSTVKLAEWKENLTGVV